MLFLYHGETAVCAAKVRLALTEKQLLWDGQVLDLQRGDQFNPDYIKLNPNSVVPTLVHDGQVFIESTVINEYLDDTFEARPLMPSTSTGRARVHLWTRREDSIHDVINTMTSVLVFRHDLKQKSPAELAKRQAAIPDPARRKKWRELLDHGLASPIVDDALIRVGRLERDREKALSNGPWLAGDAFTLADVGLISFFYRLEVMHCDSLWRAHFPSRIAAGQPDAHVPRVADWFERCKARPSFNEAIAKYITEPRRAHYTRLAGPLKSKVETAFGKALALI